MSLSNYTDMVTAVGEWLDRDDLATRAPDFIALAEARLNRLLSDPDMEVTTTTTATSESTALPDDFGEMVSISVGAGELKAMGPADFAAQDSAVAGTAKFYTIVDGAISFTPVDSDAEIRMVYRRTVPALTSSNTSNWLLTRAPDIYLYGALVQAEAYLAEDSRVAAWKSAFDEAIMELREDSSRRKWGAGPIAPRIRRT